MDSTGLFAPWGGHRDTETGVWGLLPEETLCQDGSIQRAYRLGIVAQTPYRWDAAKLALGVKALSLVDSVLLFSQHQLLAHVVLKLVL